MLSIGLVYALVTGSALLRVRQELFDKPSEQRLRVAASHLSHGDCVTSAGHRRRAHFALLGLRLRHGCLSRCAQQLQCRVGVRHHPVAPPTAAGVPGRAAVVSQVQIPCRTITCRLQTNQKSCHGTFLREITSHMNDADLSKRAHERHEKHLGAPTNVVRGARTNRAALDDAAP